MVQLGLSHLYTAGLMKMGGAIIVALGITIYFDKMYYLNIWSAEIQFFIENLFK